MYMPMDMSRIDRQIEDLQRLKASYQVGTAPQQPINNIINTQQTQPVFEARYTNENPADIFVQNKTAFIDLKNGKLTIKNIDGEMKEYVVVLPLDEKDIKIQALENKLKDMELKLNSSIIKETPINSNYKLGGIINEYELLTEPSRSVIEQSKPNINGNEPTTKPRAKGNFFKSSE